MSQHTFTLSGLGEAPFKAVQPKINAMDAVAGVFWCEHCGTALKNRHFVKSACGKISIVGIDCLRKTGDEGLIDGVKRFLREQRHAEQETARMAAFAKKEDEQREANGGRSDNEMLIDLNVELERLSAEFREVSTESSVLAMLGDSMFEQDMSHYFYLLRPFSTGQLRVLKEIVTKKTTGSRKNSKAYKAGYDAAAAIVEQAQEMLEGYHLKLEGIRKEILHIKCK